MRRDDIDTVEVFIQRRVVQRNECRMVSDG